MATGFDLVFDSVMPSRLARFWANALPGYSVRAYDAEELARLAALGLTPDTDPSVAIDGDGPTIWFQQVAEPAGPRNRIHLDLRVESRAAEVQRLLALGASVGEERRTHTLMLDPEGNRFCVFRAAPTES